MNNQHSYDNIVEVIVVLYLNNQESKSISLVEFRKISRQFFRKAY